MTDHDAAATFVFFRELAHEVDVHRVGRGPDVEMHVDIDIELARQLEDAMDLAGFVGVVARRAADHLGAALEPLDQELLGPRIADQSFLRKDADLDIDRPFVVGDQRLHALEAAHADAGIDLDLRAHAGCAMLDAFLERARGPRMRTSSTVMLCFRGVTPLTGLSWLRSCGAQRSMMRDLSRWMWVSIRPGQARCPLAS